MSGRRSQPAPRRRKKRAPRGARIESAMYDGARILGEINGRLGDFRGRDARGRSLGKFKTYEAARSAIYAADDKAQAEGRAQIKAKAPAAATGDAMAPS